MPFRILEHTADVGIIAEGKNFIDALEQAALGMFSLMGNADELERMEITISREDREELVVFLFSEILGRCEGEGFLPCRMKVLEYDGHYIKVEVFGERKTLSNIIKAVTFHMLEVKETEKGCTVQVLFDI